MAETSSQSPASVPIPPAATNSITVPTTASTSGIEALADATQLVRPSSPLKRQRTPETAGAGAPQSPLSPKALLSGGAPPLTAAAEIAEKEAKRRKVSNSQEPGKSENPTVKAMSTLMGEQGMSRLEDAPEPTSKSTAESMAGVASTALEAQANEKHLASPASTTSGQPAPSITASAEHMSAAPVASPGAMPDEEGQGPRENGRTDRLHVNEPGSAKALTYPGPLPTAQAANERRNMSVDSGMPRDETKSPASNKKHKCPYCATEFTRHHNLKSHLLTHSHEKPYLCQDCDSRFRRLHDLKRHMKLHTGERPHVCPICRRSFARGDALARHNKGQGGCAGRRSSAGSFGGDGEEMEGMIYTTGDASQEPEHMDEDNDGPSPRSSNVPSIRHHGAPDQPTRGETTYQRQPSTYPPVAGRAPNAPMGSSLYPPNAPHGAATGPQSPSGQTSPHSSYPPPGYGGGSYGQPPITESPKPLSPGQQGDTRGRSPSLSHQLNPNQFARQPTSRETLPPPINHSSAPTLPPPPGMALGPPDSRYNAPPTTSASSYPPPQASSYPNASGGGGLYSSASNSLSSHGTGPAGSGERPYSNDDRLWAIIRSLEAKVERLEGEVGILRQQLQHQQSYSAPAR
jgi:Zinc finger, C2H2 type